MATTTRVLHNYGLRRLLQAQCVSTNARLLSTETKKFSFVDSQDLVQFDTLHEMQTRSCQFYSERPLFGTYSPETKAFGWMTFHEFDQQVNKCRALLKHLGVSEYDKVGIISNNRWEWAAIACAAYSINASLVPMYEAQLPGDWTYILNDSGASTVFCATPEIHDRVLKEVKFNTPMLKNVLCLDAPQGESHAFSTNMDAMTADTDFKLVKPPTPDDLANLIYTSGTTGKPKGVELTHNNFTSNVKAGARSLVKDPWELILPGDTSLAFLPWAHSYGQTAELWTAMSHGTSLGVSRGIVNILDDLQLVKPTVLFAVPTLFKKIYDGVNNLMESSSPLRRNMMQKALYLGRQKVDAERGQRPELGFMERTQYNILDRIVLSKIRSRFGGRLRHGFVAGAACPSEVLNFMDDVGIAICEGYGLTETSPIIAINTPTLRKVGSVGKAVGDVRVYIIDEDGKEVPPGQEGEVCCVGSNVMRGYHNNKAATDEVISTAPDGKGRMFHTGDLGRVDEDGFVFITGRLKEQYKLENGKYVVPTPIEDAIGLSRFINQVVLHGANRPHNVALLVPDWPIIRKELKIKDNVTEEEMAQDERVKKLIDKEIANKCSNMKKFEIPQAWAFVAPFTAANNMLTPKMSIRRHKVVSTYADIISHLYGDEPASEEDVKGQEDKQQVA